MMQIYFAGAIRGGRGDGELYRALIRHLGQCGTVLTVHVGDEDLLKDEGLLSEKEIFKRDMDWLTGADFLVAEVTTPSLGVGYELGIAEGLDIPILCLFRPHAGGRLSAMVAGNSRFEIGAYQELPEAYDHIDRFLSRLGAKA